MKHKSTLLAWAFALALPAVANRPDSVYVKPDVDDGVRDFQIAYSVDGKHWTHVYCNLFESDYGTWGSEKKLFYPVLNYDGVSYYATFIPNLTNRQIAVTQSEDFALWKPQDYPYLTEQEFQKRLTEQKAASEKNVIKIPYVDLQALLAKETQSKLNAQMEREDYVATAKPVADGADKISATLTVDGNDRKAISDNLLGIFFEDISYAADGGLYAELIENRDFEYTADDHRGWDSTTSWHVEGAGMSFDIATDNPLHANNPHYAVLKTEIPGSCLANDGWDGIALQAKAKYTFSIFAKGKGKLLVSLKSGDETLASCTVKATADWKQQKFTLTAARSATDARLVIEPLQVGELAIDFVSLFPKDTFRGRANGLRKDLAETIADLKPRFVRFPGGCATHGQGIDNIYHWQATIGDLWERQPDMNIWNYHQTRGLGFYEYFQFCEDIGAEPLPVLAAGVPCQNSHRHGAGQQGGIPFEKDLKGKPSLYTYNGKPLTMESYLQELLDLIEWANGDAKTSELAAMRAKAGHPKPFNMKYLGIGNEDLVSDVFTERYLYLLEGIRKAHPEITVIGTVGPFWQGSDYEYGWNLARKNNIAIVDEHYYNSPGWYFNHRHFYDNYSRTGTKVYLGEWASKGNQASNALIEAAYLVNLERNADVVTMSSYAPLLANEKHRKWNPDLIYFNNTEVNPTANYYVQRTFGHYAGNEYIYADLAVDYASKDGKKPLVDDIANRIDYSVVRDTLSGKLTVKVVSLLPKESTVTVRLGKELMGGMQKAATLQLLATPQAPDRTNRWTRNETCEMTVGDEFTLDLPAFSFATVSISPVPKKK